MSVATLARALHDGMCRSLEWCDGTDHAKRWRPVAQQVLGSENPAVALHERVCPAELDHTFPKGCGMDRERHIDHLAEWLRRQGAL